MKKNRKKKKLGFSYLHNKISLLSLSFSQKTKKKLNYDYELEKSVIVE